jgi:hypothetical protein
MHYFKAFFGTILGSIRSRYTGIPGLLAIEKFEVTMGLLNMIKTDIYLLDNIASGMPMFCAVKLLNKMEELQSNSLVIYLITPEEVNMPSIPGGAYFEEDDIWINLVKSTQRVIEMAGKGK